MGGGDLWKTSKWRFNGQRRLWVFELFEKFIGNLQDQWLLCDKFQLITSLDKGLIWRKIGEKINNLQLTCFVGLSYSLMRSIFLWRLSTCNSLALGFAEDKIEIPHRYEAPSMLSPKLSPKKICNQTLTKNERNQTWSFESNLFPQGGGGTLYKFGQRCSFEDIFRLPKEITGFKFHPPSPEKKQQQHLML